MEIESVTPSLSELLRKELAFDAHVFEKENVIHDDGRSFEHARLKPYLELLIECAEFLCHAGETHEPPARSDEFVGGYGQALRDICEWKQGPISKLRTLLSEKVDG